MQELLPRREKPLNFHISKDLPRVVIHHIEVLHAAGYAAHERQWLFRHSGGVRLTAPYI
jgi:hypothetical protein